MFRNEFPRGYELRDQIKSQDSLNPFWKDLDETFQNPIMGPGKRRKFRPIEAALQSLDSGAWEFLKNKVANLLAKWDEKNARGQQQLIDILNEAFAYSFLKSEVGCSDIKFIPQSDINGKETPDLEGRLGHIKVISEVKTINISDDEALIRREMSLRFRPRCGQPSCKLEEAFFEQKLSKPLKKAKDQIQSYDPSNEARHIVYIIPNFDDMWETQKEEYFQQIDDFLYNNMINGIEIVFHNRRSVSNEIITMKNAIVFNEPEYL
ncbi:MAG: hypothetical protein NTY36_07375 [Deltaproteobacteria bacterium]|nr:hypothetical protein [Deltaproteobacteria bacterium]